ncbi:MAG: dihydrolipoyl dehydrogenase [Candidatus Aminicenantes bacterium RBG_13_59_9]|nr:MAG: dihydrolipoyl dehydrogenase [Candidatus Aminicenantes bacterium RBG_13_59_9]
MVEQRDLVIIGGGPGGYVAALRAAQLRKKVTVIEEDRVGGTCMNTGCIPTKFLLSQTKIWAELKHSPRIEGWGETVRLNWPAVLEEKSAVVDRLVRGTEFLLGRNGVEVLKGKGELKSEREIFFRGSSGEKTLEAEKIILATGSSSAGLPFLKPDGKTVITHLEALELEPVPRSLVVVGAGAIGLEIGTIYSRMGTEVTVLEILPDILPGTDRSMAARLERFLKKQGLKIFTQMRLEESTLEEGAARLKGTCLKTGQSFELAAEKILLAAGRRPNSEFLRDGFGALLGRGGFVQVNARLETAIPGVYAVGDLIGGKLLAHKASHEGTIAAENAAGAENEMHYEALPMAVFTEPELASVGPTEDEARASGLQVQVGLFSLQANGRALTLGNPEGMVKILAAPDDRIIGAHILAPFASEMIPELTLAIRKGLKVQDISRTIHIHPTVSEAMAEAALKVKGIALHALNQ